MHKNSTFALLCLVALAVSACAGLPVILSTPDPVSNSSVGYAVELGAGTAISTAVDSATDDSNDPAVPTETKPSIPTEEFPRPADPMSIHATLETAWAVSDTVWGIG